MEEKGAKVAAKQNIDLLKNTNRRAKMVKLFFFTTTDQLREIEQTETITLQSKTLFAPALNVGVGDVHFS